MRWALLLLAMLPLSCGPGEGEGQPTTPPSTSTPVPEIFHGEPGSRERGAQEAYRIMGELKQGDADATRTVLARLDAYCAENAGLPAAIETHLLAVRILADLARYEEAAERTLVLVKLVCGGEKQLQQMEAVKLFRLASVPKKAIDILEDLGNGDLDAPAETARRRELAALYFEVDRVDEGTAIHEAEIARLGDATPGWRTRMLLVHHLTLCARDEQAARHCAALWPRHRNESLGQAAGLTLAQVLARQGKRDEAEKIAERLTVLADGYTACAAHMTLLGVRGFGQPAPAVAGPCVGREPLVKAELAGRPTLAVFWDPLRSSVSIHVMKEWDALARGEHEGRYHVVGFALTDDTALITKTIEAEGIKAPQRVISQEIANSWKIRALPWVFIIDANGNWFASGWPLGRLEGLPEPR